MSDRGALDHPDGQGDQGQEHHPEAGEHFIERIGARPHLTGGLLWERTDHLPIEEQIEIHDAHRQYRNPPSEILTRTDDPGEQWLAQRETAQTAADAGPSIEHADGHDAITSADAPTQESHHQDVEPPEKTERPKTTADHVDHPRLQELENAARERASELQETLPEGTRGRVTMAVGIGEDGGQTLRTVIGTSEPNGYLRPSVRSHLVEGDEVATGTSHAERNITAYMKDNELRPITIGAGRPICPPCSAAISDAGASTATPLKET